MPTPTTTQAVPYVVDEVASEESIKRLFGIDQDRAKRVTAWVSETPVEPNPLSSSLGALADSFASAVLDAIRGASLEELLDSEGRLGKSSANAARGPRPHKSTRRNRLSRRSSEDIATALDHVSGLLKRHPDGLRAEQIRAALGMQSKEMPRVLVEGLSKRKLKKKGQKRATTYFAV